MEQRDIRMFRRRFRRFRNIMGAHLDEVMCGVPITYRQCDVLLEIENEGDTNISTLSHKLFLDKSTLSRLVEALVEIDYVSRTCDPNDRRCNVLTLTKEGRAACDKINSMGDSCTREVLELLPADRREDVVECFGLLADTMMKRALDADELKGSCGSDCCSDDGRSEGEEQ